MNPHSATPLTWIQVCLYAIALPGLLLAESTIPPQVVSILEQNCLRCHNPNISKGELALESLASALKGGEKGAAIVPGDAAASSLIDRVESGDMPEDGDPLPKEQVQVLRDWIDQGATWPETVVLHEPAAADKSWWAYQPLEKAVPPPHAKAPENWKEGAIDRFIFQGLAEEGLKPNPPADRRDLIRRVTYDLTGLPPTPEEVEAFVKDKDPKAWEKLIDRLLASPHYGERWGRHWLDVVRFGESRGFERNLITNNIWPFRDYVIRSINEDKPFDRFMMEHLAGDVIGKGNPEVEVGTAFLVAGPYDDVGNKDAMQAAIIRANMLDDMITATGTAFLGLSVNCAKCHDHKFDPIAQKDYYRLRAAFEGVEQGQRVLATEEERSAHADAVRPLKKEKDELEAQIREIEKTIMNRAKNDPDKYLPKVTRPKMDRTGTVDEFEPVTAKAVRLIALSGDRSPTSLQYRIDEFEVWTAEDEPRNVALATNGGKASASATGRAVEDTAENSDNAYGAMLVNDGKFGKRWFGASALTLTFAQPERIGKIIYSSDRPAELPTHGKMIFVGEYRMEYSPDGETWKPLTDSWDRKPINDNFLRERYLRFATSEAEAKELASLRKEVSRVNSELAKIKPLEQVWVGNFKQPKKATHLAIGGDPNKPAEAVVPASLSTLEETVPDYQLPGDSKEAERRHALAEWLVHEDNPLTPRVLANRVWHYHFGTGIVNTPSDFGYMGGAPSHPELLDYLALQLKAHGWRLKPLHREILLSQTYQQAATYREEAAAVDSDARLLWRFPPRRLSAEEIRDTMLMVAGQMDFTMGGPGFRLYRFTQDNVCTYIPLDEHGPETYRRAVYHQNPRAAKMDLLTEFDCPDPAFATPRRASTVTPLQALTLMNHSFTLDMAQDFADRLEAESSDAAGQVRHAFEIAFGREPTPVEAAAAEELVQGQGLLAFTRALFNSNELIFLN